MKAQEKAQELIRNFYAIQDTIEWTNDGELINEMNEWNETNKKESQKFWFILAKKSALITVDEFIDYYDMDFWKEVREEIINYKSE